MAAGLVGIAGYSAGSGEAAWTTRSILLGAFLSAGMVYTMLRQPERITWLLVGWFVAPLLGFLVVHEAMTGSAKDAISTLVVAVLFLGIQSAFVLLVSSRIESGGSAPQEAMESDQDGTPKA